MTSTHPYWPFFDLVVRTPRLVLRYAAEGDVIDLAALVVEGIHPPDVMPFSQPWTDVPSPEQERNSVQRYWRVRAEHLPSAWTLPFAVVQEGTVVGVQDLIGRDFAIRRAVDSGSWVGMAYQGRGIGQEMRSAVLHLAFAGLGAEVAFSAAAVDNAASVGVSRALGYEDDGYEIVSVRGEAQRQIRFRLERSRWEERRRDDIVIEGLAPCLPLLGAAAGGS